MNYDVKKATRTGLPNAFAYFTEIAKRGYAKGWNKIHPQKYKNTLSMDKISSKDSSGDGGMFNI